MLNHSVSHGNLSLFPGTTTPSPTPADTTPSTSLPMPTPGHLVI